MYQVFLPRASPKAGIASAYSQQHRGSYDNLKGQGRERGREDYSVLEWSAERLRTFSLQGPSFGGETQDSCIESQNLHLAGPLITPVGPG